MDKLATEEQYNNELFKSLINVYDPIATILIPVRNKILEELNLPKKSLVLDVACGTGTQAILLAQHGYNVTGVDLSTAMLTRAKEKADEKLGIKFLYEDATKLPFHDYSFGATIISFGLHDMPKHIRAGVLAEMKRVTKKGGRILIADYNTEPNLVERIERPISNLFESKYFDSFMEEGLKRYLDKAGLVESDRMVLLLGVAQLVVCIKN